MARLCPNFHLSHQEAALCLPQDRLPNVSPIPPCLTSRCRKKKLNTYSEMRGSSFPYFDPVRLDQRLEMLEHCRSRAFFCSVMAACALASARVRDGAPSGGQDVVGIIPAQMFFAAAEEALPKDLLQSQDFDYLRGIALLALASLQDARIGAMQMYIGHYFTMLAINQWHDESNWPTGLHPTEREERRRLVRALRCGALPNCFTLCRILYTDRCSIGRSTRSISTRPSSGMAASIFKKAMRKSSILLAGTVTKLKARLWRGHIG